MKEVGSNLLERKYATMASPKGHVPANRTRPDSRYLGPRLRLDETLYLNGRTEPSNLNILGATALNTRAAWSRDHKELVVTYQIRTKHGKEGQLIIERHLINDGKSVMVAFALRLNEAPDTISASQIWQKPV
jgi:hypothetical protein